MTTWLEASLEKPPTIIIDRSSLTLTNADWFAAILRNSNRSKTDAPERPNILGIFAGDQNSSFSCKVSRPVR